ncbi:hypothetical protein [Legionella impletisoli]|uniref:Capsule polysaccharide biosynthesis protein n=1 Tax=Legionella impletisoli TaxID=343510 RepID=A0A917NA11_9GAMM|nr:hypothetical protein [Legionella impletisoli]GGI82071.1 hypothetical protein GCM10007966_08330 [Legionella impletisoli]
MQKSSLNTVLVYLGSNANDHIEQALLDLDLDIKFIESTIFSERIITKKKPNYKDIDNKVIYFDSNANILLGKINFEPIKGNDQLQIIEKIISDKYLSLLWSRFGLKTRVRNLDEVRRYEVNYSLIKAAIKTCSEVKPKLIVFSYEPHSLPMYIFKKVSQALNIMTVTMTISPFTWRMFAEIENKKVIKLKKSSTSKKQLEYSINQFIQEKKGSYIAAKPFYEKRETNFLIRNLNKFRANAWMPHKFFMSYATLFYYQNIVVNRKLLEEKKYICVFLQFQPEQTTLPDGGLFTHQLFAIQMLYFAAEKMGISIVIREHPATFQVSYNRKWRSFDYYSKVKKIGQNIYFDSISSDPYWLIKNSLAVASITGTVLLESMLQGIPAIAFGNHPLKGFKSKAFVEGFCDHIQLKNKLAEAMSQPLEVITSDIENYLEEIYPATFGPNEYVGNLNMTLDTLRETRVNALIQVLNLIGKNEQYEFVN